MSKHAQLLKVRHTVFLGAIEEGVLTLSIFCKNLFFLRTLFVIEQIKVNTLLLKIVFTKLSVSYFSHIKLGIVIQL